MKTELSVLVELSLWARALFWKWIKTVCLWNKAAVRQWSQEENSSAVHTQGSHSSTNALHWETGQTKSAKTDTNLYKDNWWCLRSKVSLSDRMELCSRIVWKCHRWSLLRKQSCQDAIQIAFTCITQYQERENKPSSIKPIQNAFSLSVFLRDNSFKQISYGIMQIVIELSFMTKIGYLLSVPFRSAVVALFCSLQT